MAKLPEELEQPPKTYETMPPAASPDDMPVMEEPKAPSVRAQSDRQSFFGLDFNELDRDLSDEESQEWNSIYASYRGRSVMTGTIIGVDRHAINVRNQQTGGLEQQKMLCAIVIPYRVRIVIPSPEMWDIGQERPGFVLQHMVGAAIDFVIIKIDREAGFAIASRRQAVIAGKYGGGVFCNLPDGTVCMCAYSFQYEDSQFQIGDTVIVMIQRYDVPKKQIYGKIISKW